MSDDNQLNSNEQAQQEQAAAAVYNYAANLLLKEKKSAAKVRNALIEKGISKEDAGDIVKHIQNEIFEAKGKAKNKALLYGGLWLGGGILVTVISYMSTGGGGVITYGAMIYGIYLLFTAMADD